MVALSRAVPRKQAMEMLLTGDMIDAGEALRLGLVNRAVPAEALEAETLDLARKVTSKSPLILKIGKEAFYRQIEYGLVEARSEEHTSELQSLMRISYAVFCLKKNTQKKKYKIDS